MHLSDPKKGMMGSAPIVAGTISLAVGAALASVIQNDKKVTVSYFGDGASGEGVLYESLNFASLKKLPILFICENNFYSTHMPIQSCRVEKDIYKIALPFCIPSYQIDGMNVLEVYQVARKAIKRCRNGEGPVFLECRTYRFRGHVGADDNIQGTHTDIRPRKEVEAWFKKDPIVQFEEFLQKNNLLSWEKLLEIKRAAEDEVKSTHKVALKSRKPRQKELTRYVFK